MVYDNLDPTWNHEVQFGDFDPHEHGNPQFHAWWHALMAINTYNAPTFVSFMHAFHLGRRPRMAWALGCLPYVAVGKAE